MKYRLEWNEKEDKLVMHGFKYGIPYCIVRDKINRDFPDNFRSALAVKKRCYFLRRKQK